MSSVGGLSPAEQHLGEALAALVDGELPHDARDRVLAHLATCPRCKAEADEQRRLKSVFSAAAPPPPSDGLLARLENLPGVDLDDPARRSPFAGGAGGAARTGGRAGGVRAPRAGGFGGGVLDGAVLDGGPGFPIHEVERPAAARGRRFAFAAAGAVSFAALALGGALPIESAIDPAGSPAVTPGDRGVPARYSYDPQLSTSGGAQDAGPVQPYTTQSGPLQMAASATAATTATPQPPLLSVFAVTKSATPAPKTALSGMNTPSPQ
ncbi:anti-sigma factor [Streptomyces sp. WMMC500]|uniref:anti-sigma factor family protein n=1 Tax=Streptomyces sp. WMMC500 TaxID=3015154 RepID=UPI00248C0D3F|nr:anti-sigma factor [Streptomyces sp. WMMC500]WBB63285.1 anti-sigma factor [Streptomyces sp. WMMC500]